MSETTRKRIRERFDGYLPVVVDLETSGVNPAKHAILEIAAVLVDYDQTGQLVTQADPFACHVLPFEKAEIDPASLEITGIDPFHPFRFAITETEALEKLFAFVHDALQKTQCRRALLVGHNAHFDLSFLQASIRRIKIKNNPFHRFTCLDTATLGALAFGKTVLAKALKAAKIPFNKEEAHSAIYDAKQTAELFCLIVNNQSGS